MFCICKFQINIYINYRIDSKREIVNWNKCEVNQILFYKDYIIEIIRIIFI